MISEIQRQTRPVMHALWCTTVSLDLKSEATARLKTGFHKLFFFFF